MGASSTRGNTEIARYSCLAAGWRMGRVISSTLFHDGPPNRLCRHFPTPEPARGSQTLSDFHQAKRKSRRSGFSFLELIVILILMGVAAVLIMPSFTRGLKGLEVETTTRDLIVRMKQARSEAIAKQKVFRMILGVDGYVFATDFGETIKEFKLPEEVVIESDEEELPLQVSFYPNGRSSGGNFRLTSRQGKQVQVTVDSITGFARVVKDEI